MLKVLSYSVEFPTTGRTFANRIEFAPGLTAITGRNEAGKTLIFEMLAYALFGKVALRGAASDYRSLSVSLEAEIMGSAWKLERNRKEQFWIGDELVAVGAAAINREVPQRLGFGYDVFQVALAALQGDLGRLTEMQPTARRAMVDKLIGLDQLEDVEKACRDKSREFAAVATALAIEAVEPVEPEKPEDYGHFEDEIAEAEALQRERDRLLAVRCPVKPVAPVAPEDTDVEALEEHEAARQRQLQDRARLEGQIVAIPEPRFTAEELQLALAYKAYQDEVARRGPRPEYAREVLEVWQDIYHAQAKASGAVECPECHHRFVVGDEDFVVCDFETPPIAESELTTQFRRHQLWAQPLDEVQPFIIENIEQEVRAHAQSAQREQLLTTLSEVGEVRSDLSGQLRSARAYQSDLRVFTELDARYADGLREYEDAQARAAGIPEQHDRVRLLRDRHSRSVDYDRRYDVYTVARARYEATAARIKAARASADGYLLGGTALRRVRSRIQSELTPSLSRASSTLLHSLTGGERSRVCITPDFDIEVDNQPLGTLSGSGKSVVNLALRIGLGQVLTSKVLPIFCGDEIDKDMDSERAGSTHGTLRSLDQFLKQIIIVTHKNDFEADQVIAL